MRTKSHLCQYLSTHLVISTWLIRVKYYMLLCFVYFLHVVVGTWFGMALVLTTECFSKRKGMEFSGFSVDFWEIENVVTHNNSRDLPRS